MGDVDDVVDVFIEALPGFCEELLAAGKRSGDEWIVGDLEGNPGTSCHVNTAKGVFGSGTLSLGTD